jgi:predicted metalloprotease with PDZ domain
MDVSALHNATIRRLSFLFLGLSATAALASPPPPATYDVTLISTNPPKLTVVARLPVEGRALEMDSTRPADIPEVAERGWPGLVGNLKVVDAGGRSLATTSVGAKGWELAESISGRVTLSYEIDYAPLAARGWPAPREAGLADEGHVVLIGRSVFITSPSTTATVAFTLPAGWRAVTAWPESAAAKDLTENMLAFTRPAPEIVTAGGFRLLVVPMGFWEPVRGEVRRVLGSVIPALVAQTRTKERKSYLVVLLPVADDGAESYRASFALTVPEPPSRANSAAWGKMIAHEAYHQWNGWALRGKDYPSSQWFQEGFTEYAADIALTSSKLATSADFLKLLAVHVGNYRKLTTSLEAPGSHKGPPLYSGGALVAFAWDAQIREATGGKRNLWDFMHALWERTKGGTELYAWPDLQAALQATAPGDWEAFHRDHIQGTAPLPLDRAFAGAGIRFDPRADHLGELELDPDASAAAKTLLQRLMAGK